MSAYLHVRIKIHPSVGLSHVGILFGILVLDDTGSRTVSTRLGLRVEGASEVWAILLTSDSESNQIQLSRPISAYLGLSRPISANSVAPNPKSVPITVDLC